MPKPKRKKYDYTLEKLQIAILNLLKPQTDEERFISTVQGLIDTPHKKRRR